MGVGVENDKTIVIAVSGAWQSPTYREALHGLGLPRFARNCKGLVIRGQASGFIFGCLG